jgi:hypothetical protein
MFFTFPEDARWSAEQQAVEFGVEIGEYRGVGGPRGGPAAPARAAQSRAMCRTVERATPGLSKPPE